MRFQELKGSGLVENERIDNHITVDDLFCPFTHEDFVKQNMTGNLDSHIKHKIALQLLSGDNENGLDAFFFGNMFWSYFRRAWKPWTLPGIILWLMVTTIWLIYDNLVNEEVILFGSAAATSMMTIIGIAILLAPVLIRTWKEFRTVR